MKKNSFTKSSVLHNDMLPVDIVLHPSWWFHHEGITFDEDFFYHPQKRVDVERKMENVLYERWGEFGLGEDRGQTIPQIGAVHLAAGFLLSEMLGCRIEYQEDTAPQVIEAQIDAPEIDVEQAFQSPAFKRFESLMDALKTQYGYVRGDVNWGGILNIAMDLRGQQIFMDMFDKPDRLQHFFGDIAQVVERFVTGVTRETGSSSISVNRNVKNIPVPIYLHSECSHTMISVKDYENYLLPFDAAWSEKFRPYGIHYCGSDPHRYAESFAKIPHLDFLDVGWGGDIKTLRRYLPHTLLNIRLNPVDIAQQSVEEIRSSVTTLVHDSGNPRLTGVCCVNMDQQVSDEQITAIFQTVDELRKEYSAL
ncbi:MAG: hypothetical protein GY801_00450 [bacterium]|nr:hypothetical protein [bacterium]